MKDIGSIAEFQQMLTLEQAILFLDFSWSGQSKLSGLLINEWERTWNIWHGKIQASVHRLDGERFPELIEWVGTNVMDTGGKGSLTWMIHGKVVEREPYVAGAGISTIARKTQQVFGLSP